MQTLEQITPAPLAVSEVRNNVSGPIWLQMEDKSFRRIPAKHFGYYARQRSGRSGLTQLGLEAASNPVVVYPVAGREPGLYRCGDKNLLIPSFVKPRELPAAEDPPEEFQRLHNDIAELMASGEREDKAKITIGKSTLLKMFCELRGVAAEGLENNPWALSKERRRPTGFPGDDHGQMFRGPSKVIWTSQPYSVDADEIVGFAELHKLSVTVSPKWSWHCPGSSMLIEWTRL